MNAPGIWRLVLDPELKVTHIWFLRQLTREEKKHRVGADGRAGERPA